MDKIKIKLRDSLKIITTIFSLSFLYVASIILIFVGFDNPIWRVFLYIIPFFIIVLMPLIFLVSYLSRKSKLIRQAIILNQVPTEMYPLVYQDRNSYIEAVNSFLYIVNIVFGLSLILGSIFISNDTWVIVIESVWGIFIIIWSIRYLIKNKSFNFLKQIFLSLFNN